MANYGQSSCTLSTITDVEAVYTYYYLASSTITVAEAPKDNINPPGASTITVTSDGNEYIWQITEPELDIEDDVIKTAVGRLYFIECVKFSNGTYDWGPLMTSSTYAAAKAAYNLSSQAIAAAQSAIEETALLGGHFIYNSNWQTSNTPHSANVVQTVEKNGIDVSTDPTKWDYNVHIGANGIRLRNNETVLSEWTTSALRFNNPSNGKKTIELGTKNSVSILSFYNPSDGTTSMMDLTSSGLVFKNSAGAELGKFGSTGLEMSGTLNIKGGGRIGQDSDNYWKFGDYISYKDNSMAYLLGYGESSIQLGETGHWRLDKNRIHTGWYQLNDDTQGQLHFDTGADDGSTYYWDYGMHYPDKAGSGNNKFLYIRRSSDTTTSVSLATMKGRIDDDTWWTYKFYIDGDGNLHAGDIYSNGTLISGTSAPYLLKSGGTITGNLEVNGTLTKGSKNVAYLTATPTSGQILIADGTSGGIKSSGYTIATSVPSGALFTDKKVQTSQANTTRLYLVGTNTLDTSTDVLNFDSNIYADTTAGALHATTYNGYTLAAASAKGVDEGTSMPASATDNNVPTTQLMKSFVEGKGYITSYTETDPTVPSWAKAPSKPSYGLTEISGTDDIRAIEALTGTSGFLKKTAANTWTLDTNTYLTSHQSVTDNNPTLSWGTKSEIATIGSTKIYVTAMAKPTYSYSDLTSKPDPIVDATVNEDGVIIFTKNNGGTIPLSTDIAVVESEGANKLVDATHPNGINVGNGTTPVYFSGGVPTVANTYAGGTAVTLNNVSKAASTASFYAPTSGGTTAQILVGGGTTSAPTWKAISDIVPSKASTADAFSSAATVALTGDTTGSASSTKGWSIATVTKNLSYQDQITTIEALNAFGKGQTKMVVAKVSAINGLDGTWNNNDGIVISTPWGGNYGHQFYIDDNGYGVHHRFYTQAKDESDNPYAKYYSWVQFLDSNNYTSYTVKKDGTGASGDSWGISITGNAATATKATQDGSGNTITSTYVKKAGDTMTGALNMANGIANKIGDDSQLGDFNVAGTLGIQGLNGTTGIGLLQQGTTWGSSGSYAHITYDGTYVKINKLLQITVNSNTVTVGSQNNSFTHIYNSANIPFIFNNSVLTTSGSLGSNNYPFTNVNISGAYNMLVSGVQKAAMHYDSTLEAIVFSFV